MNQRAIRLLKRLGLYPLARKVYTSLGYRWAQFRCKSEAGGLPIPPAELNYLVSGTRSVRWYVDGGKWAFQSVVLALQRNGILLNDLQSVLDFGCGCGRVIRYWRDMPAQVHGCDYNARLIDWCRARLKFAHFQVNRLQPPLDYADHSFDLIYALSVFTHLDEKHQQLWIQELTRVLKPGGHLLFTAHGPCPFYLKTLGEREREQLLKGDMVVVTRGEIGANEYGAFHPFGYVKEHLARELAFVDYLPGGAFGNPYQDIYLLRKPTSKTELQPVAA